MAKLEKAVELRSGVPTYVMPGLEPGSGIETLHAFSFSQHYDPDNVRFGLLLACNEERLVPGAGFALPAVESQAA